MCLSVLFLIVPIITGTEIVLRCHILLLLSLEKFSIQKCAMLIMKSGKREMREGLELPCHERILEKRKITSIWKYWKQTLSN